MKLESLSTNNKIDSLFEQIVKDYGKSIYIYIFSIIKHKELAEDLYQEVLISAYLSFPSIEDHLKVKSWLYKIAINKCRDFWRKEKTSKKFWEESIYLYARDTSVAFEPEETVISQCDKDEMIGTLEELAPMYKEPLLLFYYHNQTLLEISNHTNTPLSTVKTRMKRAKEQLKPKVMRKKMIMLS